MLRPTLFVLGAVTAGAYVARVPMGPTVRGAAVARGSPALVRPTMMPRARTLRMAEEAAATDAAAELCVEDEAIEECTLAKWDAGEIKVRRLTRRTAPKFPFLDDAGILSCGWLTAGGGGLGRG